MRASGQEILTALYQETSPFVDQAEKLHFNLQLLNAWGNHTFSRVDQFLSVNDLDIAAARATQPATIRKPMRFV